MIDDYVVYISKFFKLKFPLNGTFALIVLVHMKERK